MKLQTLTFFVLKDVGSEATFIAHIGGIFAVLLLNDILQVVINFSTNAHGLFEVACTDRQDHELLHGQLVSGVGAAVDNVEGLWKQTVYL